jgi:hypothetical protein
VLGRYADEKPHAWLVQLRDGWHFFYTRVGKFFRIAVGFSPAALSSPRNYAGISQINRAYDLPPYADMFLASFPMAFPYRTRRIACHIASGNVTRFPRPLEPQASHCCWDPRRYSDKRLRPPAPARAIKA